VGEYNEFQISPPLKTAPPKYGSLKGGNFFQTSGDTTILWMKLDGDTRAVSVRTGVLFQFGWEDEIMPVPYGATITLTQRRP
jgi:hypothetical protein